MSAAPRIWKVPPRPAQRAEPDVCSARSAPTAMPAERPTPPRIWDTTRVRTTCRWVASRGVVVVTRSSMPGGADGARGRYPVVAVVRDRMPARPRSSGEEHFSPKEGVGSSNLAGGTHEWGG